MKLMMRLMAFRRDETLMMNKYRGEHGGRIDRSKPLNFTFNARAYQGYAGDTLASALLANGVRVIARSFKYHRPRGIVSAGIEESNALVQALGEQDEPNVLATCLPLYEGLQARSINCWPSVQWDFGELNNAFSWLFPAGFYYKTFMQRPWDYYARYIRRMAGLGQAPKTHQAQERYEKRYYYCDVLVVGAGPAGLSAALATARAGARVMLVDEQTETGGDLLNHPAQIAGQAALQWVAETVAELDNHTDVLRLSQSTVVGYYDHNMLTVVERQPEQTWLRERFWRVRAKQVIVASGAFERPLIYPNNDRPGIMLAASVRAYLHRYGVRCGYAVAIVTNNNSAYATAFELARCGVTINGIADTRTTLDASLETEADKLNIKLYKGHGVIGIGGRKNVNLVQIAPLSGEDIEERLVCDLLCHSGGWNPVVHLHSQSGAKPVYDPQQACFVPGESVQAETAIGAARGIFALQDCLEDGFVTGAKIATALGFLVSASSTPTASETLPLDIQALWQMPAKPHAGKAFVDYQNDVTAADLSLALRENFVSIEHIKRYTTAGMATDQGKTGNTNVIGVVAQQLGLEPPEVGTTTFRPPFSPVSFGAIAGSDQGQLIIPARHTPITAWNLENNAAMNEAGAHFRRPFYFPKADESMHEAIQRAALATRTSVGIYDSSPLGKYELHGPDTVTFLNRIYSNQWQDLPIDQGRFGLMLREDGRLFDDGVCFRLAESHYLLSAGTGVADAVYAHMERLLQCDWPELKVYITTVTGQWTTVCVCGPKAREVLLAAGTDLDLDRKAFPFLAIRNGKVAGFYARVARVSYTGELSFEVNVFARHGPALWEVLMVAGQVFDITPVGSETSAVLRIEKGFVSAGTEGDNITNPFDAGMGWVVAMDKDDFIGKRTLQRDLSLGGERQQVVGLLPEESEFVLVEGSAIIEPASDVENGTPRFLGHVTASCYSPNLGRSIALALLKNGRQHYGDVVTVSGLERTALAQVTKPVFIDPKGERMRG